MILLFDMNKIATLIMAIKNYYSYFFLPLILIYLLFNIFDGNNGLLSHARLNAEIASLETKVENIKKSNSLLEVKISSIKKHNKNTDLVDEQIRNVLGYGKNNEFIIFFDN
jgi:cell division protein FtsB